MYEMLCFHAQQAVEKSLKGLLLFLGIDFSLTHNLQLLISLLPDELQALPVFKEAVNLTPYAVMTRYPGEIEMVSKEQYQESIRIASAVVTLVGDTIRQGDRKGN